MCSRLIVSLLFFIVNSLNMSSVYVVTRSNAGVKSVRSVRAVKRRFGESTSPYSGLALDDEHEPPTAGLKVQSLKRSTGLYGKKVVEVKAREASVVVRR